MKKKNLSLIFIFLFIMFFPVFVSAASYNVKCEYNLSNPDPLENGKSITTIYVYLNEDNLTAGNTKVTYINRKNTEVEFAKNNSYTDYKLQYYDDFKEKFIYWYEDNKNACPDVYSYQSTLDSNVFSFYPTLNTTISSVYKSNKAQKKYTSSDGGKTWASGSNISSDKLNLIRSCEYSFSTDIGDAVNNNVPFKARFEKVKNETKNKISYDVYFTGDDLEKNYFDLLGPDQVLSLGDKLGSINKEIRISISESTIKKILDGDECLSKNELYSYNNPGPSNWLEFVITDDRQDAEDSGENIYDGDSGKLPDAPSIKDEYVDDVCETIPEPIKNYIVQALKLIRWVGLAAMILLGVLDFTKAIASDDQDALKKAWGHFAKRLIAVIILFLLPMLVDLILEIVNISTCKLS